MNAVTDARYGLCFDVETTNFTDFANPGKNDAEFHAAAMLMKANCERILNSIKEYEEAYNANKEGRSDERI
jgi:hypothetical protein